MRSGNVSSRCASPGSLHSGIARIVRTCGVTSAVCSAVLNLGLELVQGLSEHGLAVGPAVGVLEVGARKDPSQIPMLIFLDRIEVVEFKQGCHATPSEGRRLTRAALALVDSGLPGSLTTGH